MPPTDLTLDAFSPRGLNLLGSILGGGDVRVLLSRRATHPATVVLESWTVVLDPTRTNLYDLALCSRLLKNRSLRKAAPSDPERRDNWLTRRAHRQWVPRSHEELRLDYPGIVRLPGRYRPGRPLDGLRVVQKSVDWQPLPSLPPPEPTPAGSGGTRPAPRRGPGPWPEAAGFEFQQIPEIDITGAEGDFAWLLEALAAGHVPTQTVPGIDELPFVRVPFRLLLGEGAGPAQEVFEEYLSDPQNKEMIEMLMGCYRRKSEVRQQRRNLGRRTRHGVSLDANRLVDAVVGRRVGLEVNLFRQRGSVVEPVFDPREHLVVIAFDVNDLRAGQLWEDDHRRAVHRLLACMIVTYQRLEVDLAVIGFADQVLTLPDGRRVCLHLTATLKRPEDDFDAAFWHRVGHLLNRPPRFPGEACCFHPLALQDITRVFDQALREQDHSYRAVIWWARRGMPRSLPEYRTTDFLMRTADQVDRQMQDLERRLTGTLDTLASYLPRELREHGRPGQYLQRIQMP